MSQWNRYIVVFKHHVTSDQIDEYAEDIILSGGQIHNRYDTILKGFSAVISDAHITNLQGADIIDYIELDSIVTTL